MSVSAEAIVEVEKLVYGGNGLARLDGQVVLIPFVLPRERISITTERLNAGSLRGTLHEVLTPSIERTAPGCEYFGTCGGCHYQHAEYNFQLEQKRAILRETFQRLGGIAYDGEITIISGEPWHYRNRIQLPFANGAIGFLKPNSHELCPITHCPISSPKLNEVISKLAAAVKRPEWPDFLRSLEVFTNGTGVQLNVVDARRPVAARFFEWCASFLPSLAPGAIEYTAIGHTFRVSGGSFFQVNRFLIDKLVAEVLADRTGVQAVDLYAGVGLFSIALSDRFQRVDAVERGISAYRDLTWNADHSGRHVRTVKTSAEEFLSAMTTAPDVVIADPPRAGLGRKVVEELLRVAPSELVLVSCDTATLARDLRKLLAVYRIERLAIIDLFPQTYHVEAVVHLTS